MKRIIAILALASAVLFSLTSLDAQNKKLSVSGVVYDENHEPLPGAAVLEDGTTNGVVTDVDGKYKISLSRTSVIVVSCMGYKTISEPLGGRSSIDFTLSSDTSFLEEAVVVGYGTMKRSDLTGSVSSVSAKSLENFKTGTVMSALGGQIAGVSVTSADGAPGSGYNILIRGVGTVNGDASPLYIVDGFEVSNIDYIANQDIFSIEVLKDASASAIYGARAANGVVLVTTKSGTEGKTTVSYNGSASYRMLSKRLDIMTPYEYIRLQHELNSANDIYYFREGVNADGEPYRYQTMEDYKGVEGINWQDECFRNTWSQNHDVSISGGSKTSKFTASFSHYDENGIFVNSGFKKNTARVKITNRLSKKMSFDFNVNYTSQERYGMGTSGYVLKNIMMYRPTAGLRGSDDELRHSAYDPYDDNSYNDHFNPVSAAWTTDAITRSNTWMANGALYYNITNFLKFKSSASYSQYNIRQDNFYYAESQQAIRQGGAYGNSKMTENKNYSVNNVLTYDRKFKNKMKLIGTLGQEYSQQGGEYLQGQAKEFPLDVLGCDQLSVGTPSLVETSRSLKKRLSFFARGFFSYDDRYMITATVRADGSSVFAKEHRWGFFPSFAGAWTISNEPWMSWSKSWLDNLKLRVGWGTVGNDRITSYLSSEIYAAVKYGKGQSSLTSLVPRQLPNPNLKWEGSTTLNLGMDFSAFKKRLNLTVDLFNKDTKDLLLQQNLATVSGWASQWQNIGKIRNRGLEISLNTINISKRHFSWTTDFNISFIRNTLVSLLDGTDYMLARSGFDSNNTNYDYIAKVGQSLGNMYGYVFDGVYQVSDFELNPDLSRKLKPGVVNMDSHAGTTITPGWVKYKDIKADGKITPDDRAIIGNGYPDWYGGFTNSFRIFDFDFSFMFQYSYGNDVYNLTRFTGTKSANVSRNMLSEVSDRWTPYHASNMVPSAKGYTMHDIYSRFIEDGSYLRLKNVTLGYSLPYKLASKIHMSKVRLYTTATNVFCLTRYSGYDPEVSSSSSPLMPGMDNSAYPKSTALIFGAEINF